MEARNEFAREIPASRVTEKSWELGHVERALQTRRMQGSQEGEIRDIRGYTEVHMMRCDACLSAEAQCLFAVIS